MIKAIFNSQALDPDWFSSLPLPPPPLFFSALRFKVKLWTIYYWQPLFPSPAVSQVICSVQVFQALSSLSVAPLTLVFVFHCSRQMSENHPLTDLCSSTSKPPSTPTPKPCSACGWKHLEAKCTKSSCAQAWAKTRNCNGILPDRPPSTMFPYKPGLLGNARFPGLLSSQDLERVGSPGFWNKIKRSLL